MKDFLARMNFSAPDSGAGGAAAPAAAAAAAPAVADPTPAAAAPPAAGPDAPPAPSAGAEPPAAAGGPAAGGDFYKPQGLPEHLLGKDQNETMDKMGKALEGYRTRDAANGVPEKAEAYGEFTGEIPEAIKPHLATLTADPLFSRVAAKALELKISVPAYQALTQEYMSVAHEMGMMEPVVDEAAEKAALTPETARHLPENEQQQARERRMTDNYAFVDGLVAKGLDPATKQFNPKLGGLQKDDAEFVKAMIGDTAKGHRFFEAIRTMASGGTQGGPALGHQPGGQDPKAELQKRTALPENTVGHAKFNRASWEQLQSDYKRVHGD